MVEFTLRCVGLLTLAVIVALGIMFEPIKGIIQMLGDGIRWLIYKMPPWAKDPTHPGPPEGG